MVSRSILSGLIGALALTGASLAAAPGGAQSPPPVGVAGDPSAAPSPGPSAAALPTPDPDLVAACTAASIPADRCYRLGGARITLRGEVRRSVVVDLRSGERGELDVPGIDLVYGREGPASIDLDLPGTPGETLTPPDGERPFPGGARVWWALRGGIIGVGHACTVRYDVDDLGSLTGTVRCPEERTGSGKRYRVEITFTAQPVVPGPLPSPMPTAPPRTPEPTDPACGLLDGATVERTLGFRAGSLLLLGAGPGQCAGIAGDAEVAFAAIRDGATTADMVGEGVFRGADCSALPLVVAGAAADPVSAAACTWPDGRPFVAGTALRGDRLLTISLASGTVATADLLAGVAALLERAVGPDGSEGRGSGPRPSGA